MADEDLPLISKTKMDKSRWQRRSVLQIANLVLQLRLPTIMINTINCFRSFVIFDKIHTYILLVVYFTICIIHYSKFIFVL